MGWEEHLFEVLDDLEQQAEALYDAERDAELADRSRAEYQQVTLAARLMASVGRDVSLEVRGVGAVTGHLDRVNAQWCLVRGPQQDWIVPLSALMTLSGVSDRAVPEVAWSPVAKLGLGSALRRLAEAGERCVVHLRDETAYDGVVGRVGQDFLELVGGAQPLLVATEHVVAIQSRDPE